MMLPRLLALCVIFGCSPARESSKPPSPIGVQPPLAVVVPAVTRLPIACEFVAARPGGGVVVVGGFQERVELGGRAFESRGETDFFVAALTTDGEIEWARSFGGEGWDWAGALAVDTKGHVLVTGDVHGNGVFGVTDRATDGSLFLLELEATGSTVRARRYGGSEGASGYRISVGVDGARILAISVHAAFEAAGVRVEADGDRSRTALLRLDGDEITWVRPLAFPGGVQAIAHAGDGSWMLAAVGYGPTSTDSRDERVRRRSSQWVVRHDAYDRPTEAQLLPASITGLTIDAESASFAVGDFVGDITLGVTTLRNESSHTESGFDSPCWLDAFVTALAPHRTSVEWALRIAPSGQGDVASAVVPDGQGGAFVAGTSGFQCKSFAASLPGRPFVAHVARGGSLVAQWDLGVVHGSASALARATDGRLYVIVESESPRARFLARIELPRE